jgi:L-asparaginase
MSVGHDRDGRRVLVIGLGGTIAMSGPRDAVVPALSASDLVDAVPGLAGTGVAVSARSFRNLPGSYLGFADLIELAGVVAGELDAGYDGVVVTQGTDTIEESAYCLDLLHGRSEPLVVTGAMRNPTLAGADGPANLLAAIVTAAAPAARDLGCLVVLDDRIHAARRVAKTHSTSVSACAGGLRPDVPWPWPG